MIFGCVIYETRNFYALFKTDILKYITTLLLPQD